MAAYKQIITYTDDGYGTTIITVVIAGSNSELFGTATEVSILDVGDIQSKTGSKAGGLIEHELKLSIDESAIDTSADSDVLEYTTDCINEIRYIAVFVSNAESQSVDDLMFIGLLQAEVEAEDLAWQSNEWSSTVNATKKWSLVAKPYMERVLQDFTCETLINNIDETWESANVLDRQGFSDYGENIYVEKLVS